MASSRPHDIWPYIPPKAPLTELLDPLGNLADKGFQCSRCHGDVLADDAWQALGQVPRDFPRKSLKGSFKGTILRGYGAKSGLSWEYSGLMV